MAASAGGLKAYMKVLGDLPASFPAAIVIVQHLAPKHRSLMAEILGRVTPLKVKQAVPGDRLAVGNVYVAPPNCHLLIRANNTLALTQSKPVHFLRPSADLLFKSVANFYQRRAIAVVLSGTGQDGAQGVQAIKEAGGQVIVQDGKTAEFAGMPRAAIATGVDDLILPLEDIAPALMTLMKSLHDETL